MEVWSSSSDGSTFFSRGRLTRVVPGVIGAGVRVLTVVEESYVATDAVDLFQSFSPFSVVEAW